MGEQAVFIDRTGVDPTSSALWDPVLIGKAEIERQVEVLSMQPAPKNGRRVAVIVHPRAIDGALGLSPGIRCQMEVLLPGERTTPVRHNASEVNFCIEGSGRVFVDSEVIEYSQYDAWVHPSMATFVHDNPTTDRHVRLTYSNAAVLEAMQIHVYEEAPELPPALSGEPVTGLSAADGPSTEAQEDELIDLDDRGSALMSYEALITPPVVRQPILVWPWAKVRPHLERLAALGPAYLGRRLFLLYNRATGRTNGTSTTLFCTITLRPANIIDRPHRHTSAAINYFMTGHGRSVIGGRKYEWKAGDLMLTAPGWMVHHHASGDEPVFEMTIQDQPFNIAMDSLLWQEDLKDEVRLLGSHPGFATNRDRLTEAAR